MSHTGLRCGAAGLDVSWPGRLKYMAVVLGITSVAANVLPAFRQIAGPVLGFGGSCEASVRSSFVDVLKGPTLGVRGDFLWWPQDCSVFCNY